MKLFAMIALGMVSLAAQASAVYPANPSKVDNAIGTISPYRGTYYDPNKGGTGIQVDVGAGGAAFVTYYSYTSTGAPTFYVLQEVYHASDELTRWNTGVIGTMSGTFYSATGGECLGCAYTPATPVFTNYQATLTWVNSREVKMTVGSQSWDFVAPNLDAQNDGGYLDGSWASSLTCTADGAAGTVFTFALTDTLHMTKVLAADYPTIAPGSESETTFNANAIAYTGTCGPQLYSPGSSTLCVPFVNQLTGYANYGGPIVPVPTIFWYSPQTNRFGADTAVYVPHQDAPGGTYVIGPTNQHWDLYLETPNFIVGRGIFEGSINGARPPNEYDGALVCSISMVKIPDYALEP